MGIGCSFFGLSGEFWVHPRYFYPKYLPGPISLQDNNWTNPVSIWGKIHPSFWLGVRQTFSHMHSTSGDSLWGSGVIRQV